MAFDLFEKYNTYFVHVSADDKDLAKAPMANDGGLIFGEWPNLCGKSSYILPYDCDEATMNQAKSSWTKTGKTYHLLTIDEKGQFGVAEYQRGNDRFIVKKYYDAYQSYSVEPLKWYTRSESANGPVIAGKKFSQLLPGGMTGVVIFEQPTNIHEPRVPVEIMREYIQKYFSKDMIPDNNRQKINPLLLSKLNKTEIR